MLNAFALWLGYGVMAGCALSVLVFIVREVWYFLQAIDLAAFLLTHARNHEHVWTWRDTMNFPGFLFRQYVSLHGGRVTCQTPWGEWKGFRKWCEWPIGETR